MEDNTLARIITVAVLCIWFTFPLGILVSFIYQDKHQKYSKIPGATPKKPEPEYHKILTVEEEELTIDDDFEDYDDFEMPKINPHEIPTKGPDSNHLT